MKTWHVEAFVVAVVLTIVVVATGSSPIEWLGALAVFFTFSHASVAFRMQEAEERRPAPEVDCHRWLTRYHFLKEGCWLLYFVYKGAWSALVGVGVFLVYPAWRRWRSARKTPTASPG